MKYAKQKIFIITLGIIAGFFWANARAEAAAFTIDNGVDIVSSNGKCSLSEAITNINNQATTHSDCTPVGSYGVDDTIALPEGTITLTANMPEINSSLKVQGAGQNKTVIDGASAYRAFFIVGQNNNTAVSIEKLKITAYFDVAVNARQADVILKNIEIDGHGFVPDADSGQAINISAHNSREHSVELENIYVNDYDMSTEYFHAISMWAASGGLINTKASNLTVANIKNNTGSITVFLSGVGVFDQSDAHGSASTKLTNATFANIEAPQGSVAVVGGASFETGSGDSYVDMDIQNSSVKHIRAANSVYMNNGVLVLVTAAISGKKANASASIKNTLIADSIIDNGTNNCVSLDASQLFGESAPSQSERIFTSNGGNISDDGTCADIFDEPNDKNSVGGLKNTLAELANNGETVPTIALLKGSPAIDGGTCVGAPTKDARGVARPQGKTCDTGAYEFEPTVNEGIATAVGDKKSYLEVPNGVAQKSFTALSPVGIPKDDQHANYDYPLGLVSFTLAVPTGSIQEVTLYFETDLLPEDVVARKYDVASKTYSDVPNAAITEATYQSKRTLKLVYSVTDGGMLDADATVNGEIIDPIGLAVENAGMLANTGVVAGLAAPVGSLLIGGALFTYYDYRKHKKPLMAINPSLARSYTYWHHLRTVSFPVLQYRISVSVLSRRLEPVKVRNDDN